MTRPITPVRLRSTAPLLLRQLERRLLVAIARARTTGAPIIASVTCTVSSEADPSAVVATSRRPGEPWFCLEQPDREGAAVGALGSVATLSTSGEERFA